MGGEEDIAPEMAPEKESEKAPESAAIVAKMMALKSDAAENGTTLNYVGLQVLNDVDGLHVRQEWEILEQITSWYEQTNEYTIFDKDGKVQLFKAKEKTSCCWRLCCGENRPFKIKVYDTTGAKDKAALQFSRKYACCGFAPLCCAHSVKVHYLVDENGNTIGSANDKNLISKVEVPSCHGGCCFPTWEVKDRSGKVITKIHKSSCFVCDFCGADFDITDGKGRSTGKITKLRPRSIKDATMEVISEADSFKLAFKKDLPPEIKMAIIAATLQIDFTFFEDTRGICECRCCDMWCCGWPIPCVPALCCAVCACLCCKKSEADKKKNASERKGAPASEEMMR
mmetsp:Transcript_15815/g.28147  ORF Transcript_15815/g.28147 Transcript_15815/m.28147 type:complete len:341 (-) Transcript_15815:56-1078(-)